MLEAIITSSCSPNVHPVIVNAIVKTESNYNPFAIGVNRGAGRLAKQPINYAEAVHIAKQLLAGGANIDLGLGQINSANLKWLGLTVEQVLEPCANLKALQTVYLHCYDRASNTGKGTRMQRAFSCYNTGNMTGGFSNGYVAKTTKNYNELTARVAQPVAPTPIPQIQFQPKIQYQTYDTVNGSKTAIDAVQINSASQVPNGVQNATMSVPVRSSDTSQPSPTPESDLTAKKPAKVYNNWDVFRDF